MLGVPWGGVTLVAVLWRCTWGRGPRGSNGACSTVHRVSVTPSATHNEIGPLWGWFPSGWACACSRPLWVSPKPLLWGWEFLLLPPPTPTGVFNQRFEALFPCDGVLGCAICFTPPLFFPVYLFANVGPQVLLVVRLPALFVPYSASLSPATATWVLSARLPVSVPPTGLEECFFFIYLVLDFLAVRFSVSSGCARRHSVSTYTAILVLLRVFKKQWTEVMSLI